MRIEERFCSAMTSSDLRLIAHQTKDVDVVMAFGMSGSRLGSALLRLHSQYDGSPLKLKEISLLDVMLYLPDLPRVYAGLLHAARKRGIDEGQVVKAIGYWLDRNCRKCGGRGEIQSSGVVKPCPKCGGTGRKDVPEQLARLHSYINACCAAARGEARKQLELH